MQVRKMTLEDIECVREIAYENFQTTYEGILPTNVQQDFLKLAYNPERLKRRMESSVFLVFQANDELLGYANFSYVDRQGNSELLAIYVKVNSQRQKIGTTFLNYAKEKFINLKTVTINLEAENRLILNFTEKKGFICKEEFIENFQGVYLHMKRYKLFIQEEVSFV